MTDRVRITDVSPRDGLQNEPALVPAAEKVSLVRSLCAAGVDEVEVTSFVSPRWVPQLTDADEVLGALTAAPPSPRPVFSALVPNERGFERLLEHHSEAFPLKVAVFTAASETFSRKNTNASIAETIERFAAFVPRAVSMGMDVRAYVSCAVACPYEGPVEPAAVRRVCDELGGLAPKEAWESGQAEFDLGDTIGAGNAESTRALLGVFDAAERSRLVLHFHDTFGRAAECVRTGLEMGVRSFDGSVAGLGGCPYAGTTEKPAPGNIATGALVEAVEGAGFTTGIDCGALAESAALARRLVGVRA